MKSLSQAMGATIQNITLGKEICKGCGVEVELRRTIVKTEKFNRDETGVIGCKCADKEMAQATIHAYQQAKMKKMLAIFDEHSLIPPKLKTAAIDNYTPTNNDLAKAKKIALRYVETFDDDVRNLLFTGSFGVGKSHLAVGILKELMKNGKSCIFISVPKLLRKFRDSYNKNSETSEGQLVEALESVDCLVLDDLGAESDSRWVKEKLFDIIDSRQGKRTIYTSNYEPNDLLKHIGERNFSRVMNEDTTPVEMIGDNYRLRNFVE